MQSHKGDFILCKVTSIEVGKEGDFFEESGKTRVFSIFLNIGKKLSFQLSDVFHTAFGFDGSFRKKLRFIACVVKDSLDKLSEFFLLPAFHHLTEFLDFRESFSGEAGCLSKGDCFYKRESAELKTILPKFFYAGISDSALRYIDDSFEGDIVLWVHHNLHIGEEILNFSSLIEVHSTHNLIRNVPCNALLLEKTGLGVRTVEDCEVFIEAVFASDMADNFSCFFLRGLIFLKEDFLSLCFFRPEFFCLSARIFLNDRVCKMQNRRGGTIILLQLDRVAARKFRFEGQNIFEICASKAVNALIIISHHTDISVLFGKRINQAKLHIIGVLILVHENIAKTLLIL